MQAAVDDGLISAEQATRLWERWLSAERPEPKDPRFNVSNTFYYFGGMLAIAAMSLFMSIGWSAFGTWGVAAFAVAYLVLADLATTFFVQKQLRGPASIFAALSVTLIPLAYAAIANGMGLWTGRSMVDFHQLIDGRWLALELVTLLGGLAVLARHRLPFSVMPIAVTLWYMSMDLAARIAEGRFSGDPYYKVSLAFGLVTVAVAVLTDRWVRRAREADYSFWLYIFGGGMLCGAANLLVGTGLVGCLLQAVFIVGGALLGRRVFTVLGALGLLCNLGYVAHTLFGQSWMFPFTLTMLGFGLIAAGIGWQRWGMDSRWSLFSQ